MKAQYWALDWMTNSPDLYSRSLHSSNFKGYLWIYARWWSEDLWPEKYRPMKQCLPDDSCMKVKAEGSETDCPRTLPTFLLQSPCSFLTIVHLLAYNWIPCHPHFGVEITWTRSSAWLFLGVANSVFLCILLFMPNIIAIYLHIITVPGISVPVYIHLELNQTIFKILGSLTEIII